MQQRNVMRFSIYLLLFISCFSNAKSKVTEEFEYYSVTPSLKSDLRNSLDASSPIKKNGKVYYGYTKYNIKWNFWWKSKPNKCTISKVKTTLKLKYTMPKLESNDQEIKSVWERWYPNLRKHEKRHGELAKRMVRKIDNSIYQMKPRKNCKDLKVAANKLAHNLMSDLKALNVKYDKKTNHGETEHAWLYSHM